MTHVAKIVEMVGSSKQGWNEAAQAALDEGKKTLKGITGLEVADKIAKVDPENGRRAGVKIAFGVEHT